MIFKGDGWMKIVDMVSLIPMFPTKWWAKRYAQQVESRVVINNTLINILNICGWSIHDVINNLEIRQIVKCSYKQVLDIEKKTQEMAEKAYIEWLQWCVDMDCPVELSELSCMSSK